MAHSASAAPAASASTASASASASATATATATAIAERRARFRELHAAGCFVLPNAWDVGSARYLRSLGFAALASTSAGFAFSRGRPDGGVSVDEVLGHLADLVAATDLPVNADFEDGHARDLAQLAENVRRCIGTGVAGFSIEDATGDRAQPLYPIDEAVERVRTARRVIDESNADVVLVARAECFLVGHSNPLNESLRRLTVYAEAGADCLYAPGLRTLDQIDAVVQAVAPKPVNVLVGAAVPFKVDDLAALGVRRVSVGGALSRAAWTGFMHAARELAAGHFGGFDGLVSHGELNKLFEGAML
jgi:2-methylisocitrate lyase-like PEP mutase family enzyme